MKLNIVGCPDEKFQIYVIKAIEFYCSVLLSKKVLKYITINLKFDNKLKNFGTAMITGYNKQGKAREFLIEVHADIGARYIISTLAHEMIHVKQYVYGQTNAYLDKWNKEPIDSDSLDYWEHPWEIEAHGRETELLYKLNIHERLWEVFSEFNNPDSPIKKRKIIWKNAKSTEKSPI